MTTPWKHLPTTHCDTCNFTFRGGREGAPCLNVSLDCKGVLRVVKDAEPCTQEDFARAVHDMGLPTHDWLLIYADERGSLFTVSAMGELKQKLMAQAIAISFAQNTAEKTLEVTVKTP